MTINVEKITDDNRDDFVFKVNLNDQYEYTVWFSNDYYQKLTNGKVSEELLVKKSFEFLLEKEGPESILKEFELSLINRYFPDYETTIKQKILI